MDIGGDRWTCELIKLASKVLAIMRDGRGFDSRCVCDFGKYGRCSALAEMARNPKC